MAVIEGNGLRYRNDVPAAYLDENGVTETTRSVYEMFLGGRIVFLVSVVNADPDLQIQIGKPDADTTGKWHLSDGMAAKSLHPVPAADGGEIPDGFIEHVDGITVQQYIYPRLPLILTRMYRLGVEPSKTDQS